VELHVESNIEGHRPLLAKTATRNLYGACMPVLLPADLFLGQGLHLYKHVCSAFSRTAHLIEFRRHVLARRGDDLFWNDLQSIAQENSKAPLALGVITLLISHVMGDFAPEALTNWTIDRLPPTARLWVELYGHRSVFANFPGSKLYLLLQKELEAAGIPAKRSLRRALLPLKLPPAIAYASANETAAERRRRYAVELRFILSRLRFHIVEGIRYLWESLRWRQHINRIKRFGDSSRDSPCPSPHSLTRM
jgi:hypothetical protein